MLDPIYFKSKEKIQEVKQNLQKRHQDTAIIADLEVVSSRYYQKIREIEDLQAQRNSGSKQLGIFKAQKEEQKFNELKASLEQTAEKLEELKKQQESIEEEFNKIIAALPNMLQVTVPDGESAEDNVVIRSFGQQPNFSFDVKPHYEIAEKLNLIDFERGVKLSGTRFYVYNAQIARIERRLLDFMIRCHSLAGYEERMVPLLVKDHCMFGTGQFPKFQDEYYRFMEDGLSLIPTAEVPLTNLYANEILGENQLPLKLTAASSCFRREAGSAGKDTRGLIRVHQFQKVELVKFVQPQHSNEALEQLTKDAEAILQKLKLHYRVVLLCSGDISGASSKTYDLEVYMPGLKRWMEISSCSNFGDYQARRAMIRFKNSQSGKNEFVHTLNGSGVAAGRLLAALLEYYQTPTGEIDWQTIDDLIV